MTKKENENVIKQIKIAMAEMGLNQTSLAKKVGVKPNTVSQWLTGTNSPKMDTLKKVAKATGKPVNYFFDNSMHHVPYHQFHTLQQILILL